MECIVLYHVGALISKELHYMTDYEIVEFLMFNIYFQFILNAISFKKPRVINHTVVY